MKKAIFVALVVAVAFAAVSCAGAPPAAQAPADPVGDFITEARRNAPEHALLGIGVAPMPNPAQRSLPTQTATARAMADLARQLNVVVSNMITDYIAGSEADPQAFMAFQESVTQTLARAQLVGARPAAERLIDGQLVMIVELAPSSAADNILSASQSAAALAPHMGAAMWAMDRMEQAMEQQNLTPPIIRNYD
ncbi:MAG: hypothetical protein FWB79_03980 [Treponema sp.]|nr:hypothetical protein [Treponema sp.]